MKGFTLIETLIAISVLLVALGGPLSIAQQGLSAAFVARDQVVAFYLAQEAVEYVRKVRDSNGIAALRGTPTDWLSGLDACTGGGVCTVDMPNGSVTACDGVCPPLAYNTNTYMYNYDPVGSNNIESIFTREVRIRDAENPECTDCEAVVEVTVSWRTRMISKTMMVTDHVFNWQQ